MSDIPQVICGAVDFRDQQKCVRCGVWIAYGGSRHHRQRRRDGGHLVANIVLLCGSGTTGCHGWAHANPKAARACGLIVRSSVPDVCLVPLEIIDLDVSLHPSYVTLSEDGQRIPMEEALALAELALYA